MIRQFIKISIVNKMFINNSVVIQSLCEIENIEKKKKKDRQTYSTITHRSTQ